MPLLHFAFGSLHRQGLHDEQLEKFISLILDPMELKAFECPEFLPVARPDDVTLLLPVHVSHGADSMDVQVAQRRAPVSMLRGDVWMISFATVALNRLGSWEPAGHYGRLGIAFTDDFRRRVRARQVNYYEFESLISDPLTLTSDDINVRRLDEDPATRERHLFFRKPSRMTAMFRKATTQLRLETGDRVAMASISTYDRYEDGYLFWEEREARIVKMADARTEGFTFEDILCLIAPDAERQVALQTYARRRWPASVEVRIT